MQLQLPFQINYLPVYRVLHKDGRFYVIRPIAGMNDVFDVVENCRTLRFANEVCDALNEGRRK